MKKFRMIFPLVAFLVAIGGAFASSLNPPTQGYIRIYNPLLPCQTSKECNNMGPACLDQGRVVFDGTIMSSTSCGTALNHQP
jgi:hypothetical protein